MKPQENSRVYGEEDSAMRDLRRQRQKAFWYAITGGIVVALVVSLFNPSLALLGGGLLVVLGIVGAAVSFAMRWLDRQLK